MQLPSRLHDRFKVLPYFRSWNVAVIDVYVLFHIDVLEVGSRNSAVPQKHVFLANA
jgi:hypothetical protein